MKGARQMKKKIVIVLLAVFVILAMMFAEYRFIMHNIRPYKGDNGTVYLEIFGNVDTYYAESIN
jgi:hypothetical protein